MIRSWKHDRNEKYKKELKKEYNTEKNNKNRKFPKNTSLSFLIRNNGREGICAKGNTH